MKTNSTLLLLTTAAMFLAAGLSDAKEKPSKRNTKSAPVEEYNAKRKSYEASLRAEANAPGMPAEDYRRVAMALAARKAEEDRQIAAYQRYKAEQQIAMAEASAPKTYVFINGEAPADLSPSAINAAANAGRGRKTGYTTRSQQASEKKAPTTFITRGAAAAAQYPDRFARRAAQEEAFDRQDAALDAQQRSEDITALLNSAPFGVPVPGMPGYISSPAPKFQGYIDVRGYRSGAEVTDPYTGQSVRVP